MDIIKTISNRTFFLQWKDNKQPKEVLITMPDLSYCHHELWGDWGPMYEFLLNEDDPIVLRCDGTEYRSFQPMLQVDSPMIAKVRKELPFLMSIEDPKNLLKYGIYLDHTGQMGKIEVYSLMDKPLHYSRYFDGKDELAEHHGGYDSLHEEDIITS